jgi:membrane dipeptidase
VSVGEQRDKVKRLEGELLSMYKLRMTLRLFLIALIIAAFAVGTAIPQVRTTAPLLMDGHVHISNRIYWEGIDAWKPQPVGDWDFARARQAGINVVIENIAPYGYNTYNTTVKHVGRLLETFLRFAEKNRDKMEIALSSADVRRITASGKMAVILGIEAGFDQEGDVDILRLWHRLGVRLIQFASQVTTAYADSSVRGEAKWSGINERGRRLIAEMNRLGMVIDISHATEAAQRQIIEASRAPVVASHVGLRAICNNPGNLSDDILRALAAKGGMIGIHASAEVVSQKYYDWARMHPPVPVNGITRNEILYAELPLVRSGNRDFGEYIDAIDAELGGRWRRLYAMRWKEAPEAEPLVPTIDEWVAHVEHAVKIAGPKSVGIGLDLTNARSTLKGVDALSYPQLVDGLRRRQLATKEILAENWLHAFDVAKAP